MTVADQAKVLRIVLATNPDDPEANLALARLCLEAKDIWEAELRFRRVTQLQPGSNVAWNEFARLNGGEEATVSEALARRADFQAAIALHEKGDFAAARAGYAALSGARPGHSAEWNREVLEIDTAPAAAPVDAAIYVCCGKPYPALQDAIHRPIHVGRALADDGFGFPGDDVGDNISARNRAYCELTGHYWAWKNDTARDYVGLAQYRRLFLFSHIADPAVSRYARKAIPVQGPAAGYVRPSVASGLIGSADVILPQPWRFSATLEQQFVSSAPAASRADHAELWRLMIDALRRHHAPVLRAGAAAIESGRGYFYNMFVMRRPWFEAYSALLFDVLERVGDAAERQGISAAGQRGLGFLGERLMPIYAASLRTEGRARLREVPVVHLV
jgi:hypothetical protein